MSQVISYGFLSVLPLFLGAYLGSHFRIREKFIGLISAFGAGDYGWIYDNFYF